MVTQKMLLFQFSTTPKLLSFFGGLFLSSRQLVNEKVYISTLSPGLVSAAIKVNVVMSCSRWHIYIPSLASSTWQREESALCSLLTDQQ